ncbi:hypothetical protein L0775_003817 [Clostridioides difficile]|nr:hypothetical protein [Clostridioides difficile]EIS9627318.1 hypothetical protein [Clostridioides difficile]
MNLHQVLRQNLYGQQSLHSFVDMETSCSIAIIRQIIELRIRRAFGIIAFLDKDGNVKPLNMSSIFNVLKKYKKDIYFPIDLSNIERIYSWSNMFVHSG